MSSRGGYGPYGLLERGLHRLAAWLEKRGSHRRIPRVNSPEEGYLDRYYIFRSKPVSIFLHRFWSSDPDQLHCHPWHNASLILLGWYVEHHHDGSSSQRDSEDGVIFCSARELHRLEIPSTQAGRVWTLFVHGRRFRRWGFLREDPKFRDQSHDRDPLKGHFFPTRVR